MSVGSNWKTACSILVNVGNWIQETEPFMDQRSVQKVTWFESSSILIVNDLGLILFNVYILHCFFFFFFFSKNKQTNCHYLIYSSSYRDIFPPDPFMTLVYFWRDRKTSNFSRWSNFIHIVTLRLVCIEKFCGQIICILVLLIRVVSPFSRCVKTFILV